MLSIAIKDQHQIDQTYAISAGETMENNNPIQVTNTELEKLEARVNDLLQTYERLVSENKALRQQQETLVTERASLIEKNELARSRVETMITRLKSLETHS